MSIGELPIPPIWWWLVVSGLILSFIYFWIRMMREMEKGFTLTAPEMKMRGKVLQLKILETIAWTLIPIGSTVYVHGIINSRTFEVFLIASILIVLGYFAARYFRKQRHLQEKEMERKSSLHIVKR
ncbi:MAG: hypothetical protein PVF96_08630 [Candidatus Bathyarchaeota archaeon]